MENDQQRQLQQQLQQEQLQQQQEQEQQQEEDDIPIGLLREIIERNRQLMERKNRI